MLAEPGDIDEIADHIHWLIKHPVEADMIAGNGLQWAKKELWYSGAADGLDRFLRSGLGRSISAGCQKD
jgi:hypothetical protein